MRWVDAFRDPERVRRAVEHVRRAASRRWTLMEVCGGQTHAIVGHGLDALLEDAVALLHGPGCPVCVTPVETLDVALALAERPEVVLCTFGDMLRVPGSHGDLLGARSRGADVRVVYAPLDAARLAARLPEREVVFLAVGFETTAPAVALAARFARARGLANFSLLVSHVRVPPALEAILEDPGCRVQGFLAAGHVCAVMGTGEYEPLAARYRVPIVVTGFEPLDLIEGVAMAVAQLEAGEARVEIQYDRAVRPEGSPAARALVEETFEIVDQRWRGIGVLPRSGLALGAGYDSLDACRRFAGAREAAAVGSPESRGTGDCRAGEVLRGALRPDRCPAFGTRCTPSRPLGAPMVSAEGACAAYWQRAPEASP